jgi:hypothetical protein
MEVRKISYSWDSVMEQAGLDGYRLDCFVWRDGAPVVDTHVSFKTRKEFYAAVEEFIPLLEEELTPPQSASASV